jgi:hypothetical protein
MKKNYHVLIWLLTILIFILTHPAAAVDAAANGLLLWYRQVLPALLPLAILSNILVQSNYMQIVTKYLHPLMHHLLPTSRDGCFVVLGGIFFGFPMGSKIGADLVRAGKISRQEGEILSICFNQLGPVFLSGYLLSSILGMPQLTLQSYGILYLPPFLYASWHLRRLPLNGRTKKTASDSHMDFGIIDAGIMNGFESLTKLGGYIILFSIFASLLRCVNTAYPSINLLCTGLIEVTTGISFLKDASLPPGLTYSLAMFFVAFGGLCGFAQTCSMTSECSFSRIRYLRCRLLFAAVTGGLGYLLY